MKNLRGTKTAEYLLKSFAGESQARNRYTYYASIAKKESYVQTENIFTETAGNEKEHAERFFKFLANSDLNGEAVVINEAAYPIFLVKTKKNLLAGVAVENEEWTTLYPHFGDIAEAEGFTDIAYIYRRISEVEKRHEAMYRKLARNIDDDTVFIKNETILWKCNNCGYIFEVNSSPEVCPACAHPKAYFEMFSENY